jgi:hypothetical protein
MGERGHPCRRDCNGTKGQDLLLIERKGEKRYVNSLCPVRFVPMIGKVQDRGKTDSSRRRGR